MSKGLGTETSYGLIPYFNYGEYELPVMAAVSEETDCIGTVKRRALTDSKGRPVPAFRRGRLLYALPGGGTFVSKVTETSLHFKGTEKK